MTDIQSELRAWLVEWFGDEVGNGSALKSLEKIIQADRQNLLQQLKEQAKTIPVHSGTDAYYAKEHVQAVPVSVIDQMLNKMEGNRERR